jgi:hypothetical protein
MHDQVIGLLDDCVAKLMALRAELAAARCVRPGERRGVVVEAIDAAEEFAASAGAAIGETTRGDLAAVTALPGAGDPARGVTPVTFRETAC